MKRNTKLSNLLLKKYLEGSCTASEKTLVETWYEGLSATSEELDEATYAHNLDTIKEKLSDQTKVKTVKWYRSPYTVAASIAVAVSLLFGIRYLKEEPVIAGQIVSLDQEKAYILTSNGDSLNLSGLELGEKASLNGISIERKTNGEIYYHPLSTAIPQEVKIVTPPASQYRFILPDSTKVHLNAGSILVFKSDFSNENRIVTLNGEAYFEVNRQLNKQGEKSPFIVNSRGQKIKVLGTNFNVFAYDSDSFSNTTLLEGSVELQALSGKRESIILKPGQKVTLDNKKGELTFNSIERSASIDWTSGYYKFENESLDVLAKRLSRWYDVEIAVDPSVAQLTFGGRISRKEDLQKAIEILEMTGEIKVLLDDKSVKKKLIITNNN